MRLLEQAPALTQILRELVAGIAAEHLRRRAARVLERIDGGRELESLAKMAGSAITVLAPAEAFAQFWCQEIRRGDRGLAW